MKPATFYVTVREVVERFKDQHGDVDGTVHNRAPVSDETKGNDLLDSPLTAARTDPLVKWKRILAGHEDNPGYFDLDKWEFTELGKRYVQNTLMGLSSHLKRRWLHREWAAARQLGPKSPSGFGWRRMRPDH